jgi:hypothetical protein
MQVMLENITRPFMKVVVVYAMKRITAALMKNFNGSHVIVQCVKLFPPELQKVIINQCQVLVMCYSCLMLKKVVNN